VAHNPTELNRQGPDTGTQYRSSVFPANAEQARVAKSYIAQLDKTQVFGKRIATTIEPGKTFYPAEAYHQDFLTRHPDHPYIVINDIPKVDNLKRLFPGGVPRPACAGRHRRLRADRMKKGRIGGPSLAEEWLRPPAAGRTRWIPVRSAAPRSTAARGSPAG
jgi:hypothetical protein